MGAKARSRQTTTMTAGLVIRSYLRITFAIPIARTALIRSCERPVANQDSTVRASSVVFRDYVEKV